MIRRLFAGLVKMYQKTISFDHGPLSFLYPHGFCRFYPSCSEYTRQAIVKHGVIQGVFMGTKRLLRCHPWNDGGHDPVK